MKANCPHKVKIRAGGVIFLLAAWYVAWPYEFKKYSLSNQMSTDCTNEGIAYALDINDQVFLQF